ncbi:MAG: hypothetical protein AAAFM81_15080 [Pseudomonadota bacterium]
MITSDVDLLERNSRAQPGSMLGLLWSENSFDRKLFDEYCVVAESINTKLDTGVEVDPHLVAMSFFVYSEILKLLVFHFNPLDGYEIENMTEERYLAILETLDSLFERHRVSASRSAD